MGPKCPCASLMGCCMKKNNSLLKRKTKIMSTKTKFIFLMSFLALVIVGCVASMVIVLAAPKQNGILDVSIKYDAFAIRKEAEQFNGRDYYYIRMGEYPQTYAGAATSVTGLTETQETINIDLSGTWGYDMVDGQYAETTNVGSATNVFTVYTDIYKNRYIKFKACAISSTINNENSFYMDGETRIKNELSYFKIEPIKWDILGYYADDSHSTFVKCTDDSFDPTHKENLIVRSRLGLQGMYWNSSNLDTDYNASTIYRWLRIFESNVMYKFYDKIKTVSNEYMDTSKNTTPSGTVISGSVDERVWLMDYEQFNSIFCGSNSDRMISPSDFTLATYATQYMDNETINKTTTCFYWLRSSFYESGFYCGASIMPDGTILCAYAGCDVAVAPCMLVNL